MNTTEKIHDLVAKWKALSTKKKIIYGAIILFVIQILSNISTPNLNPCDCADVASKAEIIGYDNLNSKQQKLYRACESKYTYSGDAYNDCIEKYK